MPARFHPPCPQCPPEFLRTAFDCCQIDPEARPSATSASGGGEGGDMQAGMEALLREVRLYPDRLRRRKKASASSIFTTKGNLVQGDRSGR